MTHAPDRTIVSDRVREFLAADRFVTIATLDPDGSPRQALIWYRLEVDDLIVNSRVGRRWPTNLLRDPRISAAVADGHDGYRWVGLDGRVSVIRDQPTAQADIAEMTRRYHADEPLEIERMIRTFEGQERISFRIRIEAVHDHLG